MVILRDNPAKNPGPPQIIGDIFFKGEMCSLGAVFWGEITSPVLWGAFNKPGGSFFYTIFLAKHPRYLCSSSHLFSHKLKGEFESSRKKLRKFKKGLFCFQKKRTLQTQFSFVAAILTPPGPGEPFPGTVGTPPPPTTQKKFWGLLLTHRSLFSVLVMENRLAIG